MDNEEQIRQLKEQVDALTQGHKVNHDRIKATQAVAKANQASIRSTLAMLVFSAIVWGIPIAEVKWSGKEFSFTRDTTDPGLVLIGGLAAAALFAGDKPIDLIKAIIEKKLK